MKQLQDVCRDARDQKRMTAQDIADASGVPLSTVNNFFSTASRLPSIGTAGPICQVLGVSIDEYYGIAPSTDELRAEIARLKETANEEIGRLSTQLHEAELLQVQTNTQREMYANALKNSRRSSVILVVLSFLLTLSLLAYLLIDANIHNAGLIQSGKPSGVAVILMILAALSIVASLYVAVSLIKKHK